MLKRRDLFSESSVNISKIFDLVNFKDIESLPARELAYTANLASRGGVTNEKFWDRVKDAFIENDRMNGKFTSQIFLAINKAKGNNPKLTAMCLSRVARNISAFGATDLILILHAISGKQDAKVLETVGDRLVKLAPSLSAQLTAVLFASVAKLGIHNHSLTTQLLELSETHKTEFNQFEIAAVLRAIRTMHVEGGERLLESIVWSEISDSNTFSIILNACGNRMDSLVRDAIFKELPRHLPDSDLRPYLFLHAVRLAETETQINQCVQIATSLLRNFKQIKALSMPIVLEGLRKLNTLDNEDTRILWEEGSSFINSVIDRFLLLTSHEDRVKLLDSKQATVYSPWFKEKLVASLAGAAVNDDSLIQKYFAGHSVDLADIQTAIFQKEAPPNQLLLMQFIWVVNTREQLGSHNALYKQILSMFTQKGCDQFYSLLFRFLLKNNHLVEHAVFSNFDPTVCSHKTLCRFLQIRMPDTVLRSAVLAHVIDRIEDINPEDLLGFLMLLPTDNTFDGLVEAKLVRKIGQVSSLETRTLIRKRGEELGLDLTEIVDSVEIELANTPQLAKQ